MIDYRPELKELQEKYLKETAANQVKKNQMKQMETEMKQMERERKQMETEMIQMEIEMKQMETEMKQYKSQPEFIHGKFAIESKAKIEKELNNKEIELKVWFLKKVLSYKDLCNSYFFYLLIYTL